jgi:DNA-binding SARP family transcriptional activator/tetratricopeptide (TPR) repeat protein
MRVRLLGPVDVVVGGQALVVPGLRRQAALAVLALNRGVVVSTSQLIDMVWDGSSSPGMLNNLQRTVSHLRALLGGRGAIVARAPGYLLGGDSEPTDLEQARQFAALATAAADPRDRARRLAAALALWRGPSLAGLAGLRALEPRAHLLDALRLQLAQDLADARLDLGEHAELLPELERLAAERPYDERTHRQLILALYRAGRQADALTVARRLRTALRDELGLDAGPELRDLEKAVLRQDAALAAVPRPGSAPPSRSAPGSGPPPLSVPRQLPAAVAAFSGRTAELARLDALLAGDGEAGQPAVVISAVSGTAGVGKTTLGLHWAHRVAPAFPDGQLYLNLRGFDPHGAAVDPAVAVRGLLEALGVPDEQIPAGLDARTALYRSLLATRKVLVMLDNARDGEQVRPLLPATAGSLALVTSRHLLSSLLVSEGARSVVLDLLTPAESTALLARRLGQARVAAEPEAVAEIVDRCAGLPLALAITAARAALRPAFPLARFAEGLRGAAGVLDAFQGDGPSTDLRAVFSWSCQALTPAAARLFRLLGLHPGPDAGLAVAASLAAVPPREADTLLAELARAHLITEYTADRYGFHDLLREYAAELAAAPEAEAERREATGRMLDHYLHSAYVADRLLDPGRDDVSLPAARPGVTVARLDDAAAAQAWFTSEHPALLAILDQASRAGLDLYVIRLAQALTTFHNRRDLVHDWAATHETALAAAERLGDPRLLADAHRDLGRAYTWVGREQDAQAHLRLSLELYGDAGDPAGPAHAHLFLSRLCAQEKLLSEAIEHGTSAVRLFQAAGHRAGEARTLNALGWQHCLAGEHERALRLCRQALPLLEEADDREGLAHTWDTLGYVHHHLSRYGDAARAFEQSLRLFEGLGDRYHQADILTHLGDTHHAAGDIVAAQEARERALQIFDEIGHAAAGQLRAKLQAGNGRRSP